jgi:hypothetical protein
VLVPYTEPHTCMHCRLHVYSKYDLCQHTKLPAGTCSVALYSEECNAEIHSAKQTFACRATCSLLHGYARAKRCKWLSIAVTCEAVTSLRLRNRV